MKRSGVLQTSAALLLLLQSVSAFAQAPAAPLDDPRGAGLYATHCASCHSATVTDARIPPLQSLTLFGTNFIVAAQTNGVMSLQAAALTPAERIAIAEYLTGQPYVEHDLVISSGLCEQQKPVNLHAAAQWNGWSPDLANTRFQPESAGGITSENLPRLRLKWAYGLPAESQARGSPAVVGDHVFVGSQAGAVYALDAKIGCTYWTFLPQAGVRSALSVGPYAKTDGSEGAAVFFVDRQAFVYAVDANTGTQLWRTRIETHPGARGTGSLRYHEGRLYVPMSGINEGNIGGNAEYPCCTFRGSLSALDAQTGAVIWKTWTIPQPQPRGTGNNGITLWGPAGVGIWNAPTVDVKRRLLYSGTGPAYAGPAPATTDAVIAFDMDSGEIRWVNQFTVDVWSGGCGQNSDANPNCPGNNGPDVDFSASPILTTTAAGKDIIVIPQKSGEAHALDPDNGGVTLWSYRAGPGGAVGGVWGSAVEGNRMYVAVGGYFNEETGGLHAIDVASGKRLWYTPPQDLLCGPRSAGCSPTQAAAVTAVPGAVFSGAADGGLRAYSAETGEVLWTFNANQSFATVNGVPANGASFDGPGPVISGGMMYVLSGDGGFVGRPGNVLLAFTVE